MAPRPIPESRHRESRRGLWVVLVLAAAVIAMGGLMLSMTRPEPRGVPPPEVRSTAGSVDGESDVDSTGSDYDAEAGPGEGRRDVGVESGETVLNGGGSSDVEGAGAVLGRDDAGAGPLDEVPPKLGPPGLSTNVGVAHEVSAFGEALAPASVEVVNAGLQRVAVPSPLALWYPELAVSVRFESPPSSDLESGRWYRLGPVRGIETGRPPPRAIKLPPDRAFTITVPLGRVAVLAPGRETENKTIWAGRLTEASGRVQLMVESIDGDGSTTMRFGVATFAVSPATKADREARDWLRERGVWKYLGTSCIPGWGGEDVLGAMSEFVETHPGSVFVPEARFSHAAALHRARRSDEAVTQFTRLRDDPAVSAELRAWSAVQLAQVHRDRGEKDAVLAALDVDPDPGETPRLSGSVRSLREWAKR